MSDRQTVHVVIMGSGASKRQLHEVPIPTTSTPSAFAHQIRTEINLAVETRKHLYQLPGMDVYVQAARVETVALGNLNATTFLN